jgi:hypothetical protein
MAVFAIFFKLAALSILARSSTLWVMVISIKIRKWLRKHTEKKYMQVSPLGQPTPDKYLLQPSSFAIENQLFKEIERGKRWSKSKEEEIAGENKGEMSRRIAGKKGLRT